jgi:choline dehydrogenase-like flavoprotein
MRWLVVGAGSGGCVAARRLVDAGHDVTVIDAGPDLAPGGVPAAIDGPDGFAALNSPGRHFPGLTASRTSLGPKSVYFRGRGVGGSSAVNAMVSLRGDPELYRSWGWDDCEEAAERVLVPTAPPQRSELGRIDRALLASDPAATVAALTRTAGRRITAAEAYCWPVHDQISWVTDQIVDRVLFDESGAALGVATAAGTHLMADAVVLAAGAIHTPPILLRSGVTHPGVGTGLADHPAAGFLLQLTASETPERSAGLGLVTASLIDRDPIQLLAINHLGEQVPANFAMLLVANMRPVGRAGTVRLRSSDPNVHPEVDFNLLEEQQDVVVLRDGVIDALDVLRRPQFTSIVDEVFIDDMGTTVDALDSTEAIDEWLRRRGADYVHASGSTARALDESGQVVGHEGVYVCDASAFPSIPNVNTHMPTMMLAERLTSRWPGMR